MTRFIHWRQRWWYRGYIESLHWKSDISTMESRAKPLMKVNSTIGLWRFEEPVEVDDDEFYITSNVNAGDTTITIGAINKKI